MGLNIRIDRWNVFFRIVTLLMNYELNVSLKIVLIYLFIYYVQNHVNTLLLSTIKMNINISKYL